MKDLTNNIFGRWQAIYRTKLGRYPAWFCRCLCGTERVVRQDNLITGLSLSCGCYKKEVTAKTGKANTGIVRANVVARTTVGLYTKEKLGESSRRWQRLWESYKLTQGQFETILALQNGVCAICHVQSAVWHVDHDHACCKGRTSCGQCVRGILCPGCNQGLGNFRDNVKSLQNAAIYLLGSASL